MFELKNTIPDADVVLALSTEELAEKLLHFIKERLAAPQANWAGVNRDNLAEELAEATNRPAAYGPKTSEVQLAVQEALGWLERELLLVPAVGSNGSSGWRGLSRKGRELQTPADFERYRMARLLPKELIFPEIRDRVWSSFARGEYDTAAFQAMRAVEIKLREAIDVPELGVRLARAAFRPVDPKTGEAGKLTEKALEQGEQQGMMELFAGALATFKNPHSHRVVYFDNPADAAAVIIFASHLMRIIDNRWIDWLVG